MYRAHAADSSIWATVVSLASFNLDKAKDSNGAEIPIDRTYADTLIRCVMVDGLDNIQTYSSLF